MRAQLEQAVERQSQRIGCGGVRWLLNEPELMDAPARAPQAMPAICGTPQIKTGETRQLDRRCRRLTSDTAADNSTLRAAGSESRIPTHDPPVPSDRVGNRNPQRCEKLQGLSRLGDLRRFNSFEVAMIVIMRDEDTPRRSLTRDNYRMLISRRRAPIDVEHAVPLSACDRA